MTPAVMGSERSSEVYFDLSNVEVDWDLYNAEVKTSSSRVVARGGQSVLGCRLDTFRELWDMPLNRVGHFHNMALKLYLLPKPNKLWEHSLLYCLVRAHCDRLCGQAECPRRPKEFPRARSKGANSLGRWYEIHSAPPTSPGPQGESVGELFETILRSSSGIRCEQRLSSGRVKITTKNGEIGQMSRNQMNEGRTDVHQRPRIP
jgi:hypothetical protein